MAPPPLSPAEARQRIALQMLLLAMIAVSAAVLPVARMGVDLASFAPLLASVALLAGMHRVARRVARPRVQNAIELASLLLAALLPILVLSFAAMRGAAPLADDLLARADSALGIDPLALVGLVDRAPAIALILGLAYSSFSFQIGVLPVLLALSGEIGRGYRFGLAFLLLTTFASAISAFFPALGTMAHAGIDPKGFAHLDAYFGYFFLDSFHAVRSEPHFTLSATRAAGILTFPSVHAGVAVLCGWAGWRLRARWAWVALNIAMFVSAVTHGAHYVVDVLAGAALAAGIIAILSVRRGHDPVKAMAEAHEPGGDPIGV